MLSKITLKSDKLTTREHMDFNVITIMKAMIGGAGLGFALPGGLSFVLPTFTVTTTIAYSSAVVGALVLAVIAIYNIRKASN